MVKLSTKSTATTMATVSTTSTTETVAIKVTVTNMVAVPMMVTMFTLLNCSKMQNFSIIICAVYVKVTNSKYCYGRTINLLVMTSIVVHMTSKKFACFQSLKMYNSITIEVMASYKSVTYCT